MDASQLQTSERTPLLYLNDRRDRYSDPQVKLTQLAEPTFVPPTRKVLSPLPAEQERHVQPLGGRSTFGQTLFNSIAILVGIGMLSEPLAFSYAGWLGGMFLLILYATMSCYTAILLARFLFQDPRLRTYADIGRKAFGARSATFTSLLFCLELFSLSVVLVTLFADSLQSVVPTYSRSTFKLLSLLIILPTTFLPLSILAYASIIGIVASLLIIFVIYYDGFTSDSSPGSLLNTCSTSLLPNSSFDKIGMSFGLLMAGFSGHAVVPSLARDMRNPEEFEKMIRSAFVGNSSSRSVLIILTLPSLLQMISTLLYASVGGAGYLMFGNRVSDEVSKDLLETSTSNPVLNQILMWMLVVMPITKFALGTRPLAITIEALLNNDRTSTSVDNRRITSSTMAVRCLVASLSVAVSILIPEFSAMMNFLGSFSAFTICIIGPVAAQIALNRACWWDIIVISSAAVMATWGTLVTLF